MAKMKNLFKQHDEKDDEAVGASEVEAPKKKSGKKPAPEAGKTQHKKFDKFKKGDK